jgi:hypothetical protein
VNRSPLVAASELPDLMVPPGGESLHAVGCALAG